MTEQPLLNDAAPVAEPKAKPKAKKKPEPKKAEKPEPKPDIEMLEGMLDLTNIDQLIRYSNGIFNSQYKPSGMSASDIMCAIQTGAELGMKPMASVRSIAVVNGRPSIWGDAVPALCMRSPEWDGARYMESIEVLKDGGFEAKCTMARKGAEPVTRTFTTNDAKIAGYLKKDTYTKHPKRMLQVRARSWCARDAFPDAMMGMYTREEMQLADALDAVDLENSPAPKPLVERLKEQEPPKPESDDATN